MTETATVLSNDLRQTSEAFSEAMTKHGPDAKVVVLPFARYQLPRNMLRMDAEPLRFPQEVAHA